MAAYVAPFVVLPAKDHNEELLWLHINRAVRYSASYKGIFEHKAQQVELKKTTFHYQWHPHNWI